MTRAEAKREVRCRVCTRLACHRAGSPADASRCRSEPGIGGSRGLNGGWASIRIAGDDPGLCPAFSRTSTWRRLRRAASVSALSVVGTAGPEGIVMLQGRRAVARVGSGKDAAPAGGREELAPPIRWPSVSTECPFDGPRRISDRAYSWCSASHGAINVDGDDHVTPLASEVHVAVCLRDLLESVPPIDHRSEAALLREPGGSADPRRYPMPSRRR
jgi:hypothetical protein